MHRYLLLLFLAAFVTNANVIKNGTTCSIYPSSPSYPNQIPDDTPSILEAFELCGHGGSIVLTENTFHISQVMNTTNLQNCDVHLYGEMIWDTNVGYWLENSFRLDRHDASTAWLFGGENVTLRGHGVGRLAGNGQTWYDQNHNKGNQPGRPIAITFFESTNLLVDGLTWTQPQFWASFISHSSNVTMTNIHVNATSSRQWNTVNTDGTNTWVSDNVRLENWVVQNGDDCIAIKGNSSNVHIKNITCHGSHGIAIGSLGSDVQHPEFVKDVIVEDVVLHDSINAAYIKVWSQAMQGIVDNVTFRNFECDDVNLPIALTQCIYTSDPGVCDDSKMQISNITWDNFRGTSEYNIASEIHCSAATPCENLYFKDVDMSPAKLGMSEMTQGSNTTVQYHLCANIAKEYSDSGIRCDGFAPGGFPLHLDKFYHGPA